MRPGGPIVAETRSGPVQGRREHGAGVFLGVPYAQPVTAANRFAAPSPVEPWRELRAATRLGEVCPQVPTYGPVGQAAASALAAGSDFLTANIRTPALDGAAPVLFWIHGGGYALGSANEPVLQSGAFAASGVVEVTVNYRLGALGFLHLDGAPDNRGLLDLVEALRWVQTHIAAFGGDPARVTLAGRSAGGFAVAALMAMPAARGLFARALPQSGASTGVVEAEDALKLTRRLCAALEVGPAQLARVPLARLLRAQRDLCNASYEQHDYARDGAAAMLGVPFVPVLGGRSLPEHPEAAAAAGRLAPVPMMIGCTTGEYVTHATAHAGAGAVDFAWAAARLHERVRALGLSGEEIVRRYRRALPRHTPLGIWRAVAGDLVFQNPATRFARLHARHQPVWKYLFGPEGPDETGAPHGAEVGLVWYRDGMDTALQPPRQRVDAADTAFAAKVHALWASFVHAGAPRADGTAWPRFGADAPQLLRIADGAVWPAPDPFAGRPALWDPPANAPAQASR